MCKQRVYIPFNNGHRHVYYHIYHRVSYHVRCAFKNNASGINGMSGPYVNIMRRAPEAIENAVDERAGN
jgi:hypothetical protein